MLRSIKAKANSGFFLNSRSFFPWGKELACWYSSTSNGRLFLPSYRCVVTTTIPLSVFPISPMYCRPTPAVKLPLFLCPESSTINVNPLLIRVWEQFLKTGSQFRATVTYMSVKADASRTQTYCITWQVSGGCYERKSCRCRIAPPDIIFDPYCLCF